MAYTILLLASATIAHHWRREGGHVSGRQFSNQVVSCDENNLGEASKGQGQVFSCLPILDWDTCSLYPQNPAEWLAHAQYVFAEHAFDVADPRGCFDKAQDGKFVLNSCPEGTRNCDLTGNRMQRLDFSVLSSICCPTLPLLHMAS